ncbi:unnamed protein product [Closterium sp. NIES-54]
MYALFVSAEGDCYQCVPPNPGIAAAAPGASESSTLPGTAPAQALHTFTLHLGASRCFFRDSTTLTPLPAPVPVRLADPSGGPVVVRSSTVLPCPAVPSDPLSGLHLPSFSTNLVSTAALQGAMVTTTTPRGQRVSICTCTRTGHHLATFTRRPGSSLYTLATEPPQVAASAQVSASGQVAASCSCRLLSHQTLMWHQCLGHPSLSRLRGMHSRLIESGLPRSLPPLPPSRTPPCLPCIEGRQRAAPHSSSFPPTTAPLLTLHMDVWGPARVSGQGGERYFLLVVDDYTRYTTVFPLRSKGQAVDFLIAWIRIVRLQLRERFGQDLSVLRLHSDRGGEFSSSLLRDFCRGEGILQSLTLLNSPQQNGIAERHIGLIMEVARTSMIHAAAPHFQWRFAVRYAAHELNLWSRVSLPETSPTLRWTGEVGDASVFRVWGSRAFVHDTSADKLSARAIPCVVTSEKSVPLYHLFPYRSAPPLPPALFLAPGPPPVDPLLPQGPAPSGVSQVDPLPGTAPVKVAVGLSAARGATSGGAASEGAEPGGAGSGGAEPGGVEPGGAELESVEPWGAESEGVESGGAEPRGAVSSGGPSGASPRLSLQQLREWLVRLSRLRSGATGAGGTGDAGAGGAGVTARAGGTGGTAGAGPGGARTRDAGAARTGDVGGAGAGDPTKPRAAGARGSCAGGTGAGGAGVGGFGAGGAGAGGAGAVDPGAGSAGGTVRPRPYFVPVLQQVLGVPSSTSLTPPLLCPSPDLSQPLLLLASPLPAPPYTELSGGLTERRPSAPATATAIATATTATTATSAAATAAPAYCAPMASLRVLALSLFDHVSGAATAPPATIDTATRSQWLTRDAATRLAICNHLPLTECTHFGQHRTTQALYNVVVARYSSPTTAALGRLLLPYLFPELSAFATIEDLVSHLRASDARYRAAIPADFLAGNLPPMYISLYFVVTHLPDSLRSVMDHFLSLDPTSLTVDLLEQHLLAAETSAVAVGAARGTPRSPFFEGCSPSPLAPSYASAAAADVSFAEDVGAASASAKRRNGKGKGGKGGGGGSGGGGGGSGSGGGGSSGGGGGGGAGGGSGGSGGSIGGSGGSGGGGSSGSGGGGTGARRLREWFLRGASGGSCPYVIRTGDHAGQTCERLHTQHHCFSRLDDAWRAEFGDNVELPRWADLLKSRIAIFDLDFDALLSAMYALSTSVEGDCYRCVPPDPGIAAVALGASESGTLPCTAPAEALHTFTLDSSASRCFFRDSTTLTPLPAPVPVRLADPSRGPVVARSSTVLPCPAVPSSSLSGLHLPSFSTNLVSTAALHDAMATTTTHGGQRVMICMCTRTGRHLATFTRRPGSSLYTLATKPPQVAASAQVSA